jgi:chromate reductase
MKVLAISGSLRQGSYNTTVLRTAERLLPNDVEFELYDGLKWVPPYDEDDDGDDAPVEVKRLRAALAGADAVLISTPEYNSSVPGQLKNALDWASRPFPENVLRRKPSAVIGASTGLFGAVWAQAEARKVLSTIGARVVDREIPIGQADDALGANGLPLDNDARELIEATVTELIELAQAQPVAA